VINEEVVASEATEPGAPARNCMTTKYTGIRRLKTSGHFLASGEWFV
jgi:hypothetical protein